MAWLFGFVERSLADVAGEVERILGIKFELHESDMRGGEYYRHQTSSEQIILQENRDDGDIAEEDFALVPTLMYVESDRKEEIAARLGTKAALLRGT